MKRILITGAGSYIGTSVERFLGIFPKSYDVRTVDMLDGAWRSMSFSEYDAVFHVAGIAHQKETAENAPAYYAVNRDLAIEVARKAKADGVGQFIFLSSMSVYGMDTGIITKKTAPAPKSHYGKSKWQAEQGIMPLDGESFRVCILRPPMVYGKGCKGNFNGVCKLVEKLPIFPLVHNQRSMIHMDNLSSFVKLCIDECLRGVYFPQNRTYVATMDMAKGIAAATKKKIRFEYLTGFAVRILRMFYPPARKGFGSLIYQDTEDFAFSYIIIENEESYRNSVS